jgi:hypothetical protein
MDSGLGKIEGVGPAAGVRISDACEKRLAGAMDRRRAITAVRMNVRLFMVVLSLIIFRTYRIA